MTLVFPDWLTPPPLFFLYIFAIPPGWWWCTVNLSILHRYSINQFVTNSNSEPLNFWNFLIDFGTPDLERGIHFRDVSLNGVWYAFDNTKFIERGTGAHNDGLLEIDLFLERGIMLNAIFFKTVSKFGNPGRNIPTQIIAKYPPRGVSTQCARSLRPWDEMTWERGRRLENRPLVHYPLWPVISLFKS